MTNADVHTTPRIKSPPRLIWLRRLLRGIFWLCYGFRSEGKDHIPRHGPVLFAANHVTYFDPPLVAIGQDEPMHFLAWDALFSIRGFGWLIRKFGAYPVSLTRGDVAAYRATLHLLEAGQRVLIFPEAGRSDTGDLMPMRAGVAHLALRTGAPIVPVRIEGAYRVWPKGQRLPHFHRPIRVIYGPPIMLAVEKAGRPLSRQEQAVLTQKIMSQIGAFIAPRQSIAADVAAQDV